MNKFVWKESQGPSDNQTIDPQDDEIEAQNIGQEQFIDSTNVEAANHGNNMDISNVDVKLVAHLMIKIIKPIIVASAECRLSKLKLLKSYLRSIMTQERL